MRISDWSSDVCSSDLAARPGDLGQDFGKLIALSFDPLFLHDGLACANIGLQLTFGFVELSDFLPMTLKIFVLGGNGLLESAFKLSKAGGRRSEEHTSELQSLMRISYAVFCLTKKNTPNQK